MVTARDRWRWRAASSGIPRRRWRPPTARFAETLIEALAAFDAPTLVYSFYEQTRLKELAGKYPDLSASLHALIARLVCRIALNWGLLHSRCKSPSFSGIIRARTVTGVPCA